jgi:predicted O-methyltransferase YrrM
MHRFWNSYTRPLIEALQPRRILEIGAEFGWNTRHVLEYCRRTGAHLDVVDTQPLKSLLDTLSPYTEAEYGLHARMSVEVIPDLAPIDFVLLDGDHNWRTVYTELNLLWAAAERGGASPPVVIAHDCAWPYARRDMYYAPDEWREVERHPHAYRAIYPGVSELVDRGLNAQFANALEEGGPENGVLTAIEDFVAARGAITLKVLPFFNGLGIIVPDARMTPDLQVLLERFFSPPMLLEACQALEEDGMKVRVELLDRQRLLTQRTEALQRARAMLEERAARIVELEAQLAARAEPA